MVSFRIKYSFYIQNPQADTKNFEEEIDLLVYKLYNLTPEEIKIIEGWR